MVIRWILMVLAVIGASYITSAIGFSFHVDTADGAAFVRLFIGVAVLALVNVTLGNILKLLTLPLNCLTLGLFSLVINALMLWWVGGMGFGFQVKDFMSAFIGSIFISVINSLLGNFVMSKKDEPTIRRRDD